MIALIMNSEVKKDIERVKKNAEKNPTSLKELKELIKGGPAPGGINQEFTFVIPNGFTITYTHEQQSKGICRHLSMSVHDKDRVPNPVAVQMIMDEFGFINSLKKCLLWPEEFGEGTQVAMNVVEPVDGDWSKFKKEKHDYKKLVG